MICRSQLTEEGTSKSVYRYVLIIIELLIVLFHTTLVTSSLFFLEACRVARKPKWYFLQWRQSQSITLFASFVLLPLLRKVKFPVGNKIFHFYFRHFLC